MRYYGLISANNHQGGACQASFGKFGFRCLELASVWSVFLLALLFTMPCLAKQAVDECQDAETMLLEESAGQLEIDCQFTKKERAYLESAFKQLVRNYSFPFEVVVLRAQNLKHSGSCFMWEARIQIGVPNSSKRWARRSTQDTKGATCCFCVLLKNVVVGVVTIFLGPPAIACWRMFCSMN